MAELSGDPRDVDWHPRRRHSLYGHAEAEARLLEAHRSGRLHHAWLITGPRGIGKATLAYRFARFLLHNGDAASSLAVPAEAAASRLIAAGSHPDLLAIERAIDFKTKRLKTEISVETARDASSFFAHTAASGGWRVAIVDPADDLNAASANALLKILEEPPARSVFLLVSHRPGTLLRTIRSRCTRLELSPLSNDDTMLILQEIAADKPDLRQAAELSRGSPGHALELIGSKGAKAFASFLSKPRLTAAARIEIANGFAAREAAGDYAIFFELLTDWTAARSRAAGLAGKGAALAEAHADIGHSLRLADALNLDRRQTVIDALTRLDEALTAA